MGRAQHTKVEARGGYRIWLDYDDVFKAWEEMYSPSVGVISR